MRTIYTLLRSKCYRMWCTYCGLKSTIEVEITCVKTIENKIIFVSFHIFNLIALTSRSLFVRTAQHNASDMEMICSVRIYFIAIVHCYYCHDNLHQPPAGWVGHCVRLLRRRNRSEWMSTRQKTVSHWVKRYFMDQFKCRKKINERSRG